MNFSWNLVFVVFVTVVLGAVAPSGGVTDSSSDFTISISKSIDIPTRTVTIEDDKFTVSNVARRYPGDNLQVDVTAPSSDTEYDINLYNSDTKIEQSTAMTGSGTATFNTDELPAGIYYAAVYHNSNTVEIHPIVIAAYEVTLNIPSEVEHDSTVSASVAVTRRTRDRAPNFVQVVIGDEQYELQVNATEESTDTYAAAVTVDLPEGEYIAYGTARGEKVTDNGDKEIIGISNGHTFLVENPPPTPTESPNNGDGDSRGDGKTRTTTPTVSPADTDITPRAASSPKQTTTEGTIPGFGPLLPVGALLGLALLASQRW